MHTEFWPHCWKTEKFVNCFVTFDPLDIEYRIIFQHLSAQALKEYDNDNVIKTLSLQIPNMTLSNDNLPNRTIPNSYILNTNTCIPKGYILNTNTPRLTRMWLSAWVRHSRHWSSWSISMLPSLAADWSHDSTEAAQLTLRRCNWLWAYDLIQNRKYMETPDVTCQR